MLSDPIPFRSLSTSFALTCNTDSDPVVANAALVNLDGGRSTPAVTVTSDGNSANFLQDVSSAKVLIGTIQTKEQPGTVVDRVNLRFDSVYDGGDDVGDVTASTLITFVLPRANGDSGKSACIDMLCAFVRLLMFDGDSTSADKDFGVAALTRILNGES